MTEFKLAVTSENGQVFQHFGKTPEFTVFEIVDGRINGMKTVPTGENGHGALAGFPKNLGVKVLLCGGIGPGAQDLLKKEGIEFVGGVQGDVIQSAGDYLKGELKCDPQFTCNHHHHEGEQAGNGGNCHCGGH